MIHYLLHTENQFFVQKKKYKMFTFIVDFFILNYETADSHYCG